MNNRHRSGLSGKTKCQLEQIALDLGMAENQMYAFEGGLLPANQLRENITDKRRRREKGE